MNRRKRKSPYKHPVRAHKRAGVPVTNYERGKGKQKIMSRKSRVVGNPSSSSAYNVTVNYISTSERLTVKAKNYLKALGRGLLERDKIDRPKSIRMRMVN